MLFYNYHIHAQLPHNTCKPVYMAYDNSDVVNWENMEKCTYNTVRTCSENSIEIVQEQYENTALEKLKKERKGKHPNKWLSRFFIDLKGESGNWERFLEY